MFWITFLISGFIIASLPWIAGHFSDRIAGYIVLIPLMMIISLIVQYRARGNDASVDMLKGIMFGLPALLVFGLVAIYLLENGYSLAIVIAISTSLWLVIILSADFITNG